MMQIVRYYLNKHGIRVLKWMPYQGRIPSQKVVYEAYYDLHAVRIPLPVDRYSFYVCMHEIGHIVKGSRRMGYHMEYVAEQWALAKCRKYGYYTKQLEHGAKQYVYTNLIEDVVFRCLHPDHVKSVVVDWLECSEEKIRRDALRVGKKLLKRRYVVPWYPNWEGADHTEAYKALIKLSMHQLTY